MASEVQWILPEEITLPWILLAETTEMHNQRDLLVSHGIGVDKLVSNNIFVSSIFPFVCAIVVF